MTIRHAAKGAAIAAVALVGVLVTGWASMAAEPAEGKVQKRPTICNEQYLPVCGELNGAKKTYSNACFAAAAGAKVIAQGPCK